jgi:RimJ/RimL family protein N-acetyltransferase
MPSAPTIETKRLRLRPWRDEDVQPWAEMHADARFNEFFAHADDHALSIARAARLRARLDRDGFGWWIVEPKAGGGFAGVIALLDVPTELHFTPALEVGWLLPLASWGKGYATEGGAAAIRFAFERLHREEVVAMTAALNARSQRVMQRLGMSRDVRDDFDHPDVEVGHRLRPHVLFRIRRS